MNMMKNSGLNMLKKLYIFLQPKKKPEMVEFFSSIIFLAYGCYWNILLVMVGVRV